MSRIEPRTLKGFRDYLPEAMIPRERLIETARRVYRSYGFSPIDTPALEYLEILPGKGSDETDKQLYRFQDHGGRDVGMRFDLTVPLARFAAQHVGELGTPFKRYHIATVWRGENTQRGRYREFMQCDFDTIGTAIGRGRHRDGAGHPRPDAGHRLRDSFTIRVNNRLVLNGLLAKTRPGRQARRRSCARSTSSAKIGREEVAEEMVAAAGATAEQADEVLRAGGARRARTTRCCDSSGRSSPATTAGEAGRRPAAQICSRPRRPAGVPDERLQLDVSIARGLDYYTGTIFETFLGDLPGDRQRLLRRPLRQPGRAVHEAGTARHRRVARPRPAAGGDGRAGDAAEGDARRRLFLLRTSTRRGWTTTCGWRRNCAPRVSASRSIPSPRSSASSSSTPTAAAFAWRSSPANRNLARRACN